MTALPPDADKPRMVCDYQGMQIWDARDNIRIKLTVPPPRGIRWCLKDAGFKPMPGGMTWQRPHTPDAIMQAQSIGQVFFPKE